MTKRAALISIAVIFRVFKD
jgi:hypothetical protein